MKKTFYIETRNRKRTHFDCTVICQDWTAWVFYQHCDTETEARFALNDLGTYATVNEDIQFRLICVKKEEISSCSLGSWRVNNT